MLPSQQIPSLRCESKYGGLVGVDYALVGELDVEVSV